MVVRQEEDDEKKKKRDQCCSAAQRDMPGVMVLKSQSLVFYLYVSMILPYLRLAS
jgi:hypothetical protein